MAISKYKERGLQPEVAVSLSNISEYSLRAKAMLTALGDYWTNYYRNLDPIAVAATGSVASISKEYTRLLDMVRSSNILDIPVQQSAQFDLLVIDKNDVETVYEADGTTVDYYFVPLANVVDTRFLTTSLFESRVVLEKGIHYDVIHQKGYRFYVDLFNDSGITGYAYAVGEDADRHLLLWACDIAFTSTIIYERYGRFLYKPSIDSEKYKWLVSALMRFYENAKSVKCIQDVLNIMYGIPYTRYENEVIQEIYYVDQHLQRISATTEEPYICIKTDRAEYFTYAFSDLKYEIGDTVPQFSLLADFNKVEDYVDHPKWWEEVAFPTALADGLDTLSREAQNELMDKVLKYNTVHINIGVSIDTYATYLNQVKELFAIIEGGFPVYLYPLVDTFFRAVFLDKFDIEDEFKILKMQLGIISHYDWGSFLHFDGAVNFYMGPDRDYGSEADCKPFTFDGSGTYAAQEKHRCRDINVERHVGDNPYGTGWKYSHNNDREELRITKIGNRYAEEYPWRTVGTIAYLSYDNEIVSDGEHIFGEQSTELHAEFFTLVLVQRPMAEHFGEIHDELTTHYGLRDVSQVDGVRFDGLYTYNDIPLATQPFVEDNCIIALRHSAFGDTYAWGTATRVSSIKYNRAYYADGLHTFGDVVLETGAEIATVAVKEALRAEQFGDIRDSAAARITTAHTSKLASLCFDGSQVYDNAQLAKHMEDSFAINACTPVLADSYTWGTAMRVSSIKYNRAYYTDGLHTFGDVVLETGAEIATVAVKEAPIEEQFGDVTDNAAARIVTNHVSKFASTCFDGSQTYDNASLARHMEDSFAINACTSVLADSYAWGAAARTAFIKYNNNFKADGLHTFGDSVVETGAEQCSAAVQMLPFTDSVAVCEDAAVVTLHSAYTDAFASLQFNGSADYAGFVLPEQGIGESFSLRVVHA